MEHKHSSYTVSQEPLLFAYIGLVEEKLTPLHSNNTGADQPAQLCNLIIAFAICSLYSIIATHTLHAKFQHSRPSLQAGFSLMLSQALKTWFPTFQSQCRVVDHYQNWASTRENLSSGVANNKGADQPVHLHSLISAFVIRIL